MEKTNVVVGYIPCCGGLELAISKWLVEPGGDVQKDQCVCIVEMRFAEGEAVAGTGVCAPCSGRIRVITPASTVVKNGEVIATIETP